MVSNVSHFMVAGRTVPVVFGSSSLVLIDPAEPPPHATAGSTSTIANRSVISVDNSSR